jgi:hypothetical protein
MAYLADRKPFPLGSGIWLACDYGTTAWPRPLPKTRRRSSTLSEATHYVPDNNAVDWRALADQLFPADVLRAAPAFNPLAVVRNSV